MWRNGKYVESVLSLRGLEPRFLLCAVCGLVIILTDLIRQTIKKEVTEKVIEVQGVTLCSPRLQTFITRKPKELP